MKHPKIFLGLTTGVLAITAIFVSKASKSPVLITRFYCTLPNKAVCAVTFSLCTNEGGIICKEQIGSVTYTIYTLNAIGTVNGCRNGLGKCIHPVKYLDEGM